MSKLINQNLLKLSIIDMDDILRTPFLEETCRRLSHGPGFGMTKSLNHYKELIKKRSVDACGILAFYNGPAVGWLLYSYEDDLIWYRSKQNEAVAHIFVEEKWRRHGIGTRLLQLAAKMAAPDILRVYAREERDFFNPIIKLHQNVAQI